MKHYIRFKQYSPLRLRYATNENPDIRVPHANYMNCGKHQDEAIGSWGYNVYPWLRRLLLGRIRLRRENRRTHKLQRTRLSGRVRMQQSAAENIRRYT